MRKYIEEAKEEKGNIFAVILAEMFVYFCATFGFSDYVLNTLIMKKTGWVEDSKIPGSLVTAYIFPGIFICVTYLSGGIVFDWATVIICTIVKTIGSVVGSRMMLRIDTDKIKKLVGIAMLFSMAALLLKLFLSSHSTGTAVGLHGWQYLIALPLLFLFGVLNMMGVPIKPPLMSMFLLLGVSPIVTITTIMCMAVPGPIAGSISFFKSGKYSKKVFLCAATFGSLAAIIGGKFALNINTFVLTILLLIAMALVAYTMLKKTEK